MTLTLSSNDGDADPLRKGEWSMSRGLVLTCLVSMALTLSGENALSERPSSEGALDIGSRLELFVDDYLIESMEGASLKLHEPRSAGKVLTFDQPWEGNLSIALGLLRHNGAYRLYYRGTSLPESRPIFRVAAAPLRMTTLHRAKMMQDKNPERANR